MMVEDGNLEILKLLSSTSSKIAQGEILQLQHKGEVDMLEETYLNIISSKTAVLFSAATKVGAILAERNNKEKEALEFYGKNLGLTFQIADDTLDYNSEINVFGKKAGNDFYEGKITLPIILLFQQANDSEKKQLENIFNKKIRSEGDFSDVFKLISKYKVISHCYKKADHFINLASNSLSIFKNTEEKKILENLTLFSIERSF
jgi:octaprenyl-diphosphate synthase